MRKFIPVARRERVAKKIIRSFDPAGTNHRRGWLNCPHCDHVPADWHKTAVTLVLAEIYEKKEMIVVVSECPHCFEKSWLHQSFLFFRYYSDAYCEEWKAAAMEEFDRRLRSASAPSRTSLLRGHREAELPNSAVRYGVEPTYSLLP